MEAACHTDYMYQAMNALLSGRSSVADLSVREMYLAESVRRHLERAEPGARIVLAAHNAHVQKTAEAPGGPVTALPMGRHLHRMLGEDYRAVAVTHTADHVPEMYPDEGAPLLHRIRMQSSVQRVPLPAAFDAVLAVPAVTRDRSVRF